MRRRDLLAAGALSGAVSLTAGCLETLEREDAWRELVVDPPEGVYVPPKVDEMLPLASATVDGLEVSLSAMRPHSFWTMAGDERSRADVRDHHDVHLMAAVTDAETGLSVPTSVSTTIRSREERTDERTLWPMLSQRMGFHYGDNATLGEDGSHAATVRVEPTSVDASGALADRLGKPRTVDLEFEYAAAEIESLDRRLIDEDEGRGESGAVEPMGHDHGDHGSGADLEAVTEAWFGTAYSGDLEFGIGTLESGSAGGDGDAVVVSARTRHNRFPVPLTGLSIAPVRNGSIGEKTPLAERLDADLGHHYGGALEDERLEGIEELAVIVDSPPQLSRHEGYETAFFDLEPATVAVALE